jgi:nicotinamide-nucleotide amidase
MKTASIISVGTEIMRGKIDDTNSTFISRFLKERGIQVKLRISTEDEIDDIVCAIRFAEKTDITILTGGLGPTADDLTREALAKYLGRQLTFQESQWQIFLEHFKRYNRPVAESNRQQMELIEGGEFIQNPNGTAPGMFCKQENRLYVLLPGPPRENQPMVRNDLHDLLVKNDFIEGDIFTKVVRIYNAGESMVADLFKNFNEDIQLGYYFSALGWVEVHFSKFVRNRKDIDDLLPICEKGLKILDDNGLFYTIDEDLSLLVLKTLRSRNLTLSFAESITGGNLSGDLVKNPDASTVFTGGIISYSNALKRDLLGVNETTLNNFGAVSEQVVGEMVLGLKKQTSSDVCIALSGIAGPGGGSAEKPVGLVYIAFLFGDQCQIKREVFRGNRNQIFNRCINFVFSEILKFYGQPENPKLINTELGSGLKNTAELLLAGKTH